MDLDARSRNYDEGTFANIRIKNQILKNVEGGYTKSFLSNEQMSIYDAAQEYMKRY